MKNAYRALKYIITSIAFLVFVAGFILAALGAYGIVLAFLHIGEESNKIGLLAIGLLQAVDLFLIAIVFFVLSIGFMLLFNEPSKPFPVSLPEWLRVKNFIELKVIL